MSTETGYYVTYKCPACDHVWTEQWSCACSSECPHCGLQDIEALDFELDGTKTQEHLDKENDHAQHIPTPAR